ncbi:DUF881 domain-containing protein [Isoptericola sp. S6320L]|uniref:DUF881 domain-containing protein n=1 Tax=Isoptericola sp. S6320L TaxID=2926411 RepID=UPI001FF3A3D5|nr:DUF881 domain-containing protein [Isoptericola sp. S6320L]MCK0115472.1 DUF881 domain-containing protein [Isoptericola sp. S6320L]
MSDEHRERDGSQDTPATPDDATTPEGAQEGSEATEPAEPDRADDADAHGPAGPSDEPLDPLDLSVPVASIVGPDGGDPPRETSAGSVPGTWPGPGTGSVPAVSAVVPPEPQADREDVAPPDGPPPAGGWRALAGAMRPRANRSQLLAAVLCAALGFALVVQVQQSAQDPLSSARQDDLVRLLDEVTQRSEQLADQVAELSRTRDELQSGTGQAQAAVDLAQERAGTEGILSGRLPAVGPGVEIVVRDPDGLVDAAKMFNVLEELRNAGAEVVELDGVRLVTSTWFRDTDEGIVVDDQVLDSPYRWTVIGDPSTLSPALEIPGGALATLRTAGAEATITQHDEVEVTAVREPPEPQYATPQGPEG